MSNISQLNRQHYYSITVLSNLPLRWVIPRQMSYTFSLELDPFHMCNITRCGHIFLLHYSYLLPISRRKMVLVCYSDLNNAVQAETCVSDKTLRNYSNVHVDGNECSGKILMDK